MYTLIVLGLIPGTQFEITFLMWLFAVGGLSAMVGARLVRRAQLVEKSLVTATLLVATKRFRLPA